jgi:predicted lipoprotein with Yx(FWY)xxD motif
VRHPSVLASTALMCAGLIVAGCGSSNSKSSSNGASGHPAVSSTTTQSTGALASGASASSGGTVIGTVHTSLGTILAGGPKHLTVYLFAADKGSTSSCSGACAQVWPPVTTTGSPRAEGGALAADLGTTTGSEGAKQITYKGHPLYYYVSDQSSGETTGQGINSFGAPWYVLDPQGAAIH